MVVTRRMAKLKLQTLNQTKHKRSKYREQRHQIKDCVVKLERISPERIAALTAPPPKKIKRKKRIEHKRSTALAKSSSQSVIMLWAEAKRNRKTIPKVNCIILAKMFKYSPWPSKLVEIRNKSAYVYFFGTNNHGTVKLEEIVDFGDTHLLVKKLSTMKIQYFSKAVREAEVFQGIPSENSILNQI